MHHAPQRGSTCRLTRCMGWGLRNLCSEGLRHPAQGLALAQALWALALAPQELASALLELALAWLLLPAQAWGKRPELEMAPPRQPPTPGCPRSSGTPQSLSPPWGLVTSARRRPRHMVLGNCRRSMPSRRSRCSSQGLSATCCSSCRRRCRKAHCWLWARTIAACSADTGGSEEFCSGWSASFSQRGGTNGLGSWGRWAGNRRGGH
mmetsp:Transcript_47171/g.109072  ORF Transcript_47171/g.109072 Transcript_47171/m.109072 type:complete len:207 (+) Transcript_47171:723-1343(+)